MNIVYEDRDVIGVVKPPGIPSQQDLTGDVDMLSNIARYLGQKPEEVYPVHRLDRPVGGLILYCKHKKAAAALSRQMQEGAVSKTYLCVVCGVAKAQDTLTHALVKNNRLNISKIVHANTPGAKQAKLVYEKLGGMKGRDGAPISLIKVRLLTGRHHQIRVQMAGAGLPLWGDTKYNKDFKNPGSFASIALYSWQLGFVHPADSRRVALVAPWPESYPFTIFPKEWE